MGMETVEAVRVGFGEWLCAARAASPSKAACPRSALFIIPLPKCELHGRRVCGCVVLLDRLHSRWSIHFKESESPEVPV